MVNTVIRYTNVKVDTLLHGNINLTTDANQEFSKQCISMFVSRKGLLLNDPWP